MRIVLRSRPFKVIVADPPWSFNDDLPSYGKGSSFGARGASGHYDCLPLADISDFRLSPDSPSIKHDPQISKDSVLLLWKVAAMPSEALTVCEAWGYTPKAEIVWVKKTSKGNRHFGMGRYVRAEHETCIIAARGKASQLVKIHNVRSVFEAPVPKRRIDGKLKSHSAKPEEFFDLVESLLPGPYVELFARRRRQGWTCKGNEVDGHKTWRIKS